MGLYGYKKPSNTACQTKSEQRGSFLKMSEHDFLSKEKGYDLWWALLRVRQVMYKARARELAKYRISPAEAAVLFFIEAIGDKTTPAEISRRLFLEPHSVSGITSRMEKNGLIKKTNDLERKNLVRVVMTKKGRNALNNARKRESIDNIMSSLSRKEREQMRVLVGKLWDKALEELRKGYRVSLDRSPLEHSNIMDLRTNKEAE